MKSVSHLQASQLLHNKFIVVLGDSIQRAVYKDLVLLVQKEKYLSLRQLRSKGEMTFEQDCLVEGGCLGQMHNGTEYKEVRQFQSAHHLVRFYFVTRIYSRYMKSILEDFRHGLKPDLVFVNSCVWDISSCSWVDDYKENLHRFFDELREALPEETLVVWNLTMPLGERIKGGFLVPEIEHKAPQLRYDVIEANFYSGTLADAYGMDVLDLHFQFRFSLHHRMKDGVHWNAVAHRKITSLLLQHAAEAWGVILPCPVTVYGERKSGVTHLPVLPAKEPSELQLQLPLEVPQPHGSTDACTRSASLKPAI
uniref:Family with sequence similarity 113 n=1 Tax=Neolamprologus brichardi TaxID=32507 RepID=A0A3Q4GDW0_NEOBR